MATIKMSWETRPAVFKLPYDRPTHNLKKNIEYTCDVLGLFQYSDGDCLAPYFICELPDGSCAYIDPDHLRFTDKGGENDG